MHIIKLLSTGILLLIIAPSHADTTPATTLTPCSFATTDGSCGPVKYRKNIDELTKEELAAYEHAVDVMRKKSAQNIFDRTGFLWQAWVHDCTNISTNKNRDISTSNISAITSCDLSPLGTNKKLLENPGMCEHAKDTFLQWHRAEFYFYEKALQAADPEGKTGPSTKDVTVPYWNFTKKPSGQRYPKAFENPESPLFNSNRNQAPLTSPLPYTSPYLLAYMIYFLDWPEFGGYPSGSAGNYGALEAQIHNYMHDEYVGGFMKDPRTAGLEPVFYSFHAFLDYSFERWIEEHGSESITSSKYFMRGEQDDDLPKPDGFSEGTGTKRPGKYTKNMGRGDIYFDTRKQGYAYQAGRDGEFIPKAIIQSLLDKHAQAGFHFGEGSMSLFSDLISFGSSAAAAEPKAVLHGDLRVPPQITNANVTIKRRADTEDYSFQADIYLHPKSVDADISNAEFRNKYLAASTAYWALSDHHHGHVDTLVLTQSFKQAIAGLAPTEVGKEWQLTLGLSGDANMSAKQFDQLIIQVE